MYGLISSVRRIWIIRQHGIDFGKAKRQSEVVDLLDDILDSANRPMCGRVQIVKNLQSHKAKLALLRARVDSHYAGLREVSGGLRILDVITTVLLISRIQRFDPTV